MLNLHKVYHNTKSKKIFLFLDFGYPIKKENTQLSCKWVGKVPNWSKAYLGCWNSSQQ